jgi:hypothetical protein
LLIGAIIIAFGARKFQEMYTQSSPDIKSYPLKINLTDDKLFQLLHMRLHRGNLFQVPKGQSLGTFLTHFYGGRSLSDLRED